MNIFLATAPDQSQNSANANGAIIVAVIMAIASIIGTAVGAYYTFHAARRNAEVTRDVERKKLDNESWAGWREDAATLRRQRKEDREEYDTHRKDCDEKIRNLTARVEQLGEKQEQERQSFSRQRRVLETRIDALTIWGRHVVTIMKMQGLEFPAPPPGLTDTNPEGVPAQTWD
jgi:septal ring factor EnvC (AmiA/AmiB activator)